MKYGNPISTHSGSSSTQVHKTSCRNMEKEHNVN